MSCSLPSQRAVRFRCGRTRRARGRAARLWAARPCWRGGARNGRGLELEGVVRARGANAFGHFGVAMQGVRGDDAAFQIKAFQDFESRRDLVCRLLLEKKKNKSHQE